MTLSAMQCCCADFTHPSFAGQEVSNYMQQEIAGPRHSHRLVSSRTDAQIITAASAACMDHELDPQLTRCLWRKLQAQPRRYVPRGGLPEQDLRCAQLAWWTLSRSGRLRPEHAHATGAWVGILQASPQEVSHLPVPSAYVCRADIGSKSNA